jgi:hypothetical protein
MLQQYQNNLTRFVNSLEKSDIQIVYFSLDREKTGFDPILVTALCRWDRKDGLCYVNPGVTPGWCYVYIWDELGSFKRVGEMSGYIGNHLTFGLLGSKGKVLLKTHFTRYRNISDNVNEYDRRETVCNMYLEGEKEEVVPLDRLCEGDEDGYTLGMRFTKEKSSVVQDISRVCYGSYKREHEVDGGEKRVCMGKRGGMYVSDGGKKRYLLSGGGCNEVGDLSTPGFIQFITKYVLNPVLAVRKDMIGARMLYDKRDELGRGSHRNIVLMYELRDIGMHLYFIDAGKAFTAYRVYLEGIDKVSMADKKCFEEFVGMVERVLVAGETVVG